MQTCNIAFITKPLYNFYFILVHYYLHISNHKNNGAEYIFFIKKYIIVYYLHKF